MNEKDLIEQMVQDTFTTNNDENVLHFPKIKTFRLKAFHDKKRKCLIIHSGNDLLEVPEFWGPFKYQMGNKVQLTFESDTFGFVEVLQKHFKLNEAEFLIEIENDTNLVISKAA